MKNIMNKSFKLHLIKRYNTILGTSTLTYLNKHATIAIRIFACYYRSNNCTTICDMCEYVNSIQDILLRYARLVKF